MADTYEYDPLENLPPDPYRQVELDPNRPQSQEADQSRFQPDKPIPQFGPPTSPYAMPQRQMLPTVPPTPQNNQPPDPPFFGASDFIRLEGLNRAYSKTVDNIDSRVLDPVEYGPKMIAAIQEARIPLLNRQRAHQEWMQGQQVQQMHKAMAMQEALGQENKVFQAQGFQQTAAPLVNPVTGEMAMFIQKQPGQWEEVLFEKHHQDREHLMAREEMLNANKPEGMPADPGEEGFVDVPGRPADIIRPGEQAVPGVGNPRGGADILHPGEAAPEQLGGQGDPVRDLQPDPAMERNDQGPIGGVPLGPVTVRPGESSDDVAAEMGMDLPGARATLSRENLARDQQTYGPLARQRAREAGVESTPLSSSGPKQTSQATLNALYQRAEATIPQPNGAQPRHVWEERRKGVNQLFELLLRNHEQQQTHRATLDYHSAEQRRREQAISDRHLADQQHQLRMESLRGRTIGGQLDPAKQSALYRSIATHLEDKAREINGRQPSANNYIPPAQREGWMASPAGIQRRIDEEFHRVLNLPVHRPGEPLPAQTLEEQMAHTHALEAANHPDRVEARRTYDQRFAQVQAHVAAGRHAEAAALANWPAPAGQSQQPAAPGAQAPAAQTDAPATVRPPAQQAAFLQQQLQDIRAMNWGIHERQDIPEARRDAIRQGLVQARNLLERHGSVAAMPEADRQRYRAAILAANVPVTPPAPRGPGPNTERPPGYIYPAERR